MSPAGGLADEGGLSDGREARRAFDESNGHLLPNGRDGRGGNGLGIIGRPGSLNALSGNPPGCKSLPVAVNPSQLPANPSRLPINLPVNPSQLLVKPR